MKVVHFNPLYSFLMNLIEVVSSIVVECVLKLRNGSHRSKSTAACPEDKQFCCVDAGHFPSVSNVSP